jgi:septum formation protein
VAPSDVDRRDKKRAVRIDATRPLVLGSASPRRREMISLLGVPFVVRPAEVDESMRAGESPAEYLARVTRAKLDAVRAAVAGAAAGGVLVADTIVVGPGGAILGKPRDDDEARAMIEQLAGAMHEVSTRFALAGPLASDPIHHGETVTTRVAFRALDAEEVRQYVVSGEGRDKAGAYAVQGRAGAFVQRIEGSYGAVVGLPLCELVVAMRAIGWLA